MHGSMRAGWREPRAQTSRLLYHFLTKAPIRMTHLTLSAIRLAADLSYLGGMSPPTVSSKRAPSTPSRFGMR